MATTFAPAPPARALRALFEPRVIAVVGAGRERGRVGAEVFHNLAEGGYTGRVVPVNPNATTIGGLTAYASVRDIPGEVDLCVIAVPAPAVESVVDDCIAKQVGAIVVITAGFGETGDAGHNIESRLREKVRAAGIRMIGPNCMGVLNADPALHMNATFSPVFPPSGSIAFSSQSGALGLAILEYAKRLNLGISNFVSVGNKADVSTNDLLEYWDTDPHTSVILVYVESFGNPRRFAKIAREVSRRKPIVAVKAGRSRSGARAACSHTGALASSDTLVDALFHQAGVIRTETLEELFDVAALLAHQPLPPGPRVAILTNAGGPGILAADACESLGLTLPSLAPDTVAALRAFLPSAASVANPVDMLATASAEHYARAIPLLLNDPGIDSLLTIFIPPLLTSPMDVARAIADGTRGSAKPVLATFFGAAGVPDMLAPIPCYQFPESAARALAHAVSYTHWRDEAVGQVPVFQDVDVAAARRIVDETQSAGGGWLPPDRTFALLRACGINAVETRTARTLDEALEAAARVGYPLVLKGAGPRLLHKTEAHAVYTNIGDEAGLRKAYADLASRDEVESVTIQPMVRGGAEMIVGATLDPKFGHVIVCGSGGTLVELLGDTQCRLAPLTDRAAAEMLDEVQGIALLRGFRGAPVGDEAALRTTLLRVSALLDACPQIAELDLNPVIVTPEGAFVVDARVRVAPR